MRPANFLIRTLTALVFGILMITSIIMGSVYLALLMLFVFFLGIKEFYKLVTPGISNKATYTGIITGSFLFIIVFCHNAGWLNPIWLWITPVLLFSPFVVAMFDTNQHAVKAIGATFSGLVFLALPLSLFASISLLGDYLEGITGSEFLLIFLLILWVFDSFAYIAGSWFGKHKLFGRLSPGKTWEGSMGGFMLGLVAAMIISLFYTSVSTYHWLALAALIMVFGTLGDLCESMIKRNAGVKDSGRILPGHGGILDRFDALLMSAPIVYFYTIMFIITDS